jgi:hypothetical protein
MANANKTAGFAAINSVTAPNCARRLHRKLIAKGNLGFCEAVQDMGSIGRRLTGTPYILHQPRPSLRKHSLARSKLIFQLEGAGK